MMELTAALTAAMTPLIAGLVDVVTENVMAKLQMQNATPRYYTAKQVAELLHVSLPTVRRMSKNGAITPMKVPGMRGIRYDANVIDSAITESKIYRYKHTK